MPRGGLRANVGALFFSKRPGRFLKPVRSGRLPLLFEKIRDFFVSSGCSGRGPFTRVGELLVEAIHGQ